MDKTFAKNLLQNIRAERTSATCVKLKVKKNIPNTNILSAPYSQSTPPKRISVTCDLL